MKRGELWWADLPSPPRGAEPGFRRPVLVVSADAYNKSSIGTVLIVVVTSNIALAEAPGNVRLGKKQSGLPAESVINVSQLATMDKRFLIERVKALPATLMNEVDAGLKRALELR